MTDHSLSDPHLKSLEARLAATAPHLSTAEQGVLLYQSAFAAGQLANRKTLRSWQATATVLSVLLVTLSIPVVRDRWLIAEKKTPLHSTTEIVQRPGVTQVEVPTAEPPAATVGLDAWQVQHSNLDSLTDALAQIKQTDPQQFSFSVSALSRTLMQP